MYNCINGEPLPTPLTYPSDVIAPIDLSFGSPLSNETTYHVYYNVINNTFQYETHERELDNCQYKFSFKMIKYFLEKRHEENEKKVFQYRSSRSRVGYEIYRDGRKVTGCVPKKFAFEAGSTQGRGKGIRIVIVIPNEHVNAADEHFNIGTNKKITEDSFESFNSELQEFLRINLVNADKEKTDQQKILVAQYIASYKNKIDNEIPQYTTEEELNNEIERTDHHLTTLEDDGVYSRKSSKLYKYIQGTYKDALEARRSELEYAEDDDSDDEDDDSDVEENGTDDEENGNNHEDESDNEYQSDIHDEADDGTKDDVNNEEDTLLHDIENAFEGIFQMYPNNPRLAKAYDAVMNALNQ